MSIFSIFPNQLPALSPTAGFYFDALEERDRDYLEDCDMCPTDGTGNGSVWELVMHAEMPRLGWDDPVFMARVMVVCEEHRALWLEEYGAVPVDHPGPASKPA